MNHYLSALLRLLAARFITPAVILFFAALYVAISFFTEEAFVTIVGLLKTPLFLILFIVPLNLLARLVLEARQRWKKRLVLKRGITPEGTLFHEQIELHQVHGIEKGEKWLNSCGYQVRRFSSQLTASKGISLFPSRALFLLGSFLLVLGIALSFATRRVMREAVIEGESLPFAGNAVVEKISLTEKPDGLVFARDLKVRIHSPGKGSRDFGLYPPAKMGNSYLYYRYLGVAPLLRLSAPDLQGEASGYYLLAIYPPGREDTAVIPNSPYRLTVALVEPPSGRDPYVSEEFIFQVRCFRGQELQFSRDIATGGSISHGGLSLSIPEARKLVATDFLRDQGFPFIWIGLFLLVLSLLFFIPIRLLAPLREIVICRNDTVATVYSRAEGRKREHDAVFHELLDLVDGDKTE